MNGFYKAAANCAPPLAQLTIEKITTGRVVLYGHVPPSGDNIPFYIEPFYIDYMVPAEEYIEWVVRRLSSNLSEGPYGMRV